MNARRLFGDDIDPALRMVLLTVALNFTAQAAFFAYFPIWAIERLDAPASEVGLALGLAGVAAVTGALVGGRLSDRIGRRPVIVAAAAAQTAAAALFVVPELPRFAAYALAAVITFSQPLRGAPQRALIADLVEEARLEQGFGAFRVVQNVGFATGPLIGAALVAFDWRALHVGVCVGFALSLVSATRLAAPGTQALPAGQPLPLRKILSDRPFLYVFVGGICGFFVATAFYTLLPVSLTQTHGLPPAAWGPVYALNPLLVVILQMRITRWSARLGSASKLALGMLLMGLPFLALPLSAALPVVVLVASITVLGEMLWSPGSEAIVSRLAPPGMLGLYLGTATAAAWLGNALAPAVGLNVRAGYGDSVMWVVVASVALAGAVLYVPAVRAQRRRALSDPAPVIH